MLLMSLIIAHCILASVLLSFTRIFLSLMEMAGLTDLLKQEGSYTIFAPTDEAFESLNKEDLELLKSKCGPELQNKSTSFPCPFVELGHC